MRTIPQIFTKETCEIMQGMDPQERKQKLAGAITAFFQGKHPCQTAAPALEIAKAIGVNEELAQKFLSYMIHKGMTGPSDAPNLMNRNSPITSGVFYTAVVDPLADFGYEDLFDFVDMRGSGQTSFDILDVSNGITFKEIKPGEKMKVYGITDAKMSVSLTTQAAAIGILDRWVDYAQFWNINQAIIEAQAKYYDKQAEDHYALLTAISSGQNQAFSTDDITTINNACAQIFNDLAGKGYVLTGNERFVLRANPTLKSRIEKAFALTFNGMSTSPNQIVYNIDRVYTTKLASTSYYVGLPGRKAKRGTWKDLSSEANRDILRLGTDIAYVGEYNAAIGEEDQFRRCALS
ncbi:MAG: hypothetical protein WC291_08310 [Thermodesulfovibrionales bacterium]|jgi:hypothetical protein